MSLLDDVSIVVTPNGYKAGELYAVVPVPTEGTELVTNGDFATDSDWTKTGGATISGGKANIDGDGTSYVAITQTNVFTEGIRYKVTVDAVITSGLGLKIQDGANNENIGAITTTGLYEFDFIATSNSSFVIGRRTGGTAFDSSVDNVSVKEYTAADMDVTRATAATRVDEAGLVNYAEVLGSEEVTNGDFATDLSGWNLLNTDVNNTIVWDNGKVLMTGNGVTALLLNQDIFEIGKTYRIELDAYNITGAGFKIYDTQEVLAIQSNGNYTVYHTALSTSFNLYRYQGGLASSGEFDNISVKEVTRDNVPRIDYSGGGCPHILAEPQRTNEVTYSEDFSNAYFQKIRSTISTDQISSPDGTQNADKFIEDSSNNTHLLWTQDYVVSIGDSLTWSVFAKKGERDFIVLQESNAGNFYAFFDLDNGVIGTTSGVDSSKIEDLGSGWYRCSITYTTTGTTAKGRLYLADSNNSQSYQGNGTSGLYIWGAQLEEGSFPTSYIPTSGSTVTRNQDIFTRDGIGSLIGQTEGSIYFEFKQNQLQSYTQRILTLYSDSANLIEIQLTSSNELVFVSVKTGESAVVITKSSAITLGSVTKISAGYKAGDFVFYVNGVQAGTDTDSSKTIPQMDNLLFSRYNSTAPFLGSILNVQLYKTRLTNTQLAALTS